MIHHNLPGISVTGLFVLESGEIEILSDYA